MLQATTTMQNLDDSGILEGEGYQRANVREKITESTGTRYNSTCTKLARSQRTALLCKGSVASSGHFIAAIPLYFTEKQMRWRVDLCGLTVLLFLLLVLNKPFFIFHEV